MALVGRHRAQIPESVLHHRLAIRWHGSPAPRRIIHPHAVLGRHALQRFGACQAAFPLLVGHLVHLVQLPHNTLLLRGRKVVETRVVAQGPLLLLNRLRTVFVEP